MSTNKEESKMVDKTHEERISNFQEFISEVEKEVNDEIVKSSINDDDLTKKAKIRNGIMNRIWYTITSQLLGKFKVKITLYYKEKVIFEYIIPKN